MLTIRLNLTLIDIAGEKEIKMHIEEDTSLSDILGRIGIPDDEIGIVIKNGQWASYTCSVGNQDVIELFPPLSGG